MSDIFREVDEALQQEKVEKIWKEYGPTLIVAAVLLVLSTAVTTAWVAWNTNRNETETARLVQAMEEGDNAAAALETLAEDTRSNHEALALLSAAGLKAEKENFAGAAALYKQAYEQSGPRAIRDLARILYVRSTLAAAHDSEENKPSSAELVDVLQPVLKNDDSPWQWPAKIDAALITAHLDNDYTKAAAYLDGATSITNVPPSLAERVNALYQLYTAQAATQSNNEKDAQG